mgnify:CR=1 FL=1
MRIKRRNGLVSALLGLVTCGLYHIFFWYQYGEDTNWVCRDDRKMTQNYIVAWILSWITCGIYGLYWTYQLASRLDQAGDRYNVHIESPVIFTIVMHIPFLSYFYACDVMNNFADAYEKTAPQQTESQRDYYDYTGNTTAQTPPPVWPTSGSNPNGTSVNPNGFDFKSTMEDVGNNLKDKAKEHNITLSLHAPYFISLSSLEAEKRDNSINYILQSCDAASRMGADRIVIHSGSCAKISREDALELAKDTLTRARKTAVEQGFEHIVFCPETMGKVNQLGNLTEVLELCKLDDTFLPTIDFGHLNAREFGYIKGKAEYEKMLDEVENAIGHDRLKIFHSHFSKIMFTNPGGEKKHLTFDDNQGFGPDYEPLMEIVAKKDLSPIFVCESAGTQDKDALTMKNYYLSVK